MKAQFLACGKKEHKDQKANDCNLLQSLQNGLVCDVSSALISAFALRTLTSNKHIPCISTLLISFRSGAIIHNRFLIVKLRYLDEEQERAMITATLMYYVYMSCRERGSDEVVR